MLGSRFVLTLLALVACACPALAEPRRLAFVAGIDIYPQLGPEQQLKRAVADADAVADTLGGLGYQVTRLTRDVTKVGFLTAFSAFTRSVERGDTVVFFFAGHGIALDNANYLLPADIPRLASGGESVIRGQSIPEQDIVADISARGAGVTVLVIDACRNNPFPRTGTRALGGLARGLRTADPPEGMFSLYSAGSGQEALDRLSDADPNPNSVFTRVLLVEMRKPGVSLIALGETVRTEVRRLARTAVPGPHIQVPAYYNQLVGAGSTFLAGRSDAALVPVPPAPPARGEDEITWSFLEFSGNAVQIEAWMRQFPSSALIPNARARLERLKEERAAEMRRQREDDEHRARRAGRERAEAEARAEKAEAEARRAKAEAESRRPQYSTLPPPQAPASSWRGIVCNAHSQVTNIRSGPSAKGYAVVAALSNGDGVTVVGERRNDEGYTYYEVRSGSRRGFVFAGLVRDGTSCSGAQARSSGESSGRSTGPRSGRICNARAGTTNMRAGPSAERFAVVRKLTNNTVVTVIGEQFSPSNGHKWLQLRLADSRVGFVDHELVCIR